MKKKALAAICVALLVLLTACTVGYKTQVSDEKAENQTGIFAETTEITTEELVDNAPSEGLPDENCPLEHVIEEENIPAPEPDATPVPDAPPAVKVVGENGQVYNCLLGTYCWSNEEFTTEACTMHPLECLDLLPKIETAVAGHSVCLEFDGLHMEDYTVKYWEVEADQDDSHGVTVDRNCGRIEFDLSTAGKQCVYSVWVEYPEGYAEYCFLVDYNCR